MDEKKILFPYNFTEKDKRSLDYIIRTYAQCVDLKITIFHAYIPVPEITVNKKSVMGKITSDLHYLSQKLVEQKDNMVEVKKLLVKGGFKDSQVNYLYTPKKRDIANEIIYLAKDGAYNIIILNRSGKVTSFFKASVFNKVVTALKDVTVTIVA